TVRVQRIGVNHTSDTTANGDGRWGMSGLSGGRYRVWAFLQPSLADATPTILFLADGDKQSLTLDVDRYTGLTISSNHAPDPPGRERPGLRRVHVAVRQPGSAASASTTVDVDVEFVAVVFVIVVVVPPELTAASVSARGRSTDRHVPPAGQAVAST